MSILKEIAAKRDALFLAAGDFEDKALRTVEDAERDSKQRMEKLREDIKEAAEEMRIQIAEAYGEPEKTVTSEDFVVVKDDTDS